MKDRTAKCPKCGKQIFRYAQICPYCKTETKFVSIDDEMSQSRVEKEIKVVSEEESIPSDKKNLPTVLSSSKEEKGKSKSQEEVKVTKGKKKKKHGRMDKYVNHLKQDAEKVHEKYDEKIGRRFSKSTILISAVIILLSLTVLGLYIAVQRMNKETFGQNTSVDRAMKLRIDSVENNVLKDSKILAKFPDRKRHCLIYIRNNELHYYNGVSQVDSILNLPELNPQAVVDKEGGILDALLSTNEQYLMMIVSRKPGNTECGLYRLNIETRQLEVIDMGQVVREKDGFKVTSGRRTAIYDSMGDKISGMTGKEMDAFEAQAAADAAAQAERERKKAAEEKKNAEANKVEKTEEKEPVQEKSTEQVLRNIDVVPKPVEPKIPDKLEIKTK